MSSDRRKIDFSTGLGVVASTNTKSSSYVSPRSITGQKRIWLFCVSSRHVSQYFSASSNDGRRGSFSADGTSYSSGLKRLAVVPGHPLRGVGRQLLNVALEFGQIIERVGAT